MAASDDIPSLAEAMAEIRRLRARVAELEGVIAWQHGTLAPPASDGSTLYTHNVPPSAPPHDE